MIICTAFPGDHYVELQLQQHDAYGQALAIMIHEAKARLEKAEALLGPSPLGDLVRRDEFDHHVVQDAHDLLAACYRAERGLLQPPLPFAGQHVEKFATEWLDWLRARMARMDDCLIRSLLVLAYIDPDPEHSDEGRLLDALRRELRSTVRWKGYGDFD